MTIQEFEIFHGKKLYKSANNCRLIINRIMFNQLADLNAYERKNIFHKMIAFLQEQASKDHKWIQNNVKELSITNKELNATISASISGDEYKWLYNHATQCNLSVAKFLTACLSVYLEQVMAVDKK